MTSLRDLSTPTTNAERADRLHLISTLSVAAVPRACLNPSQLQFPKYKDGWSLVYLSHKLQHETLIEIRRRVLGVRVRHPWRSSDELQVGLRRLITRWELSVRALKCRPGGLALRHASCGLAHPERCGAHSTVRRSTMQR